MVEPRKLFGGLGNRLFQMAYIYGQMRRGIIFDIYVQNPVYFEQYKDEIKQWFGDGIREINKVAVHVRRGANPTVSTEPKYCENPFVVNLCETDYYEKAMTLFPDEEFIIFTDDPDYCKARWPNIEVREGQSDIEDLNEMASCKGVIMANSSFSWWGAFLSNGKVVAPKKYYADGIERTKYPKHWITI